MALPAPTYDQAFCNVSALEGGTMSAPDDLFIADAVHGERPRIGPSLCFLIQHSRGPEIFLFDLGINKDLTVYPPAVQKMVGDSAYSDSETPQRASSPSRKKSTFLVRGDSHPLFEDENPLSTLASDLYPADRTRYLPVGEWPPLGPFPHALDFYSPGHAAGHINVLARTSSDGAWIYLAADSAHHWRILTGESQIKTRMPYGQHFCIHDDKSKAEEHIANIRALGKLPRVQILLAHDVPWYNLNKGGDAFWPGKIQPLADVPLAGGPLAEV